VTDFGGTKTLDVTTIRLDDVADLYGVEPRIIKLDVEGAEYMALQGAAELIEKHKPMLVLEVTDPLMEHVARLHEYLQSRSYQAHIIREKDLVPISELTSPEANVVYC